MKMQTFEEIFTEEGIIPEWIERGVKKGLEQGIEQGSTQEKFEIARKLKGMGLPVSQIAEGTNLSPEVIEQL